MCTRSSLPKKAMSGKGIKDSRHMSNVHDSHVHDLSTR